MRIIRFVSSFLFLVTSLCMTTNSFASSINWSSGSNQNFSNISIINVPVETSLARKVHYENLVKWIDQNNLRGLLKEQYELQDEILSGFNVNNYNILLGVLQKYKLTKQNEKELSEEQKLHMKIGQHVAENIIGKSEDQEIAQSLLNEKNLPKDLSVLDFLSRLMKKTPELANDNLNAINSLVQSKHTDLAFKLITETPVGIILEIAKTNPATLIDIFTKVLDNIPNENEQLNITNKNTVLLKAIFESLYANEKFKYDEFIEKPYFHGFKIGEIKENGPIIENNPINQPPLDENAPPPPPGFGPPPPPPPGMMPVSVKVKAPPFGYNNIPGFYQSAEEASKYLSTPLKKIIVKDEDIISSKNSLKIPDINDIQGIVDWLDYLISYKNPTEKNPDPMDTMYGEVGYSDCTDLKSTAQMNPQLVGKCFEFGQKVYNDFFTIYINKIIKQKAPSIKEGDSKKSNKSPLDALAENLIKISTNTMTWKTPEFLSPKVQNKIGIENGQPTNFLNLFLTDLYKVSFADELGFADLPQASKNLRNFAQEEIKKAAIQLLNSIKEGDLPTELTTFIPYILEKNKQFGQQIEASLQIIRFKLMLYTFTMLAEEKSKKITELEVPLLKNLTYADKEDVCTTATYFSLKDSLSDYVMEYVKNDPNINSLPFTKFEDAIKALISQFLIRVFSKGEVNDIRYNENENMKQIVDEEKKKGSIWIYFINKAKTENFYFLRGDDDGFQEFSVNPTAEFFMSPLINSEVNDNLSLDKLGTEAFINNRNKFFSSLQNVIYKQDNTLINKNDIEKLDLSNVDLKLLSLEFPLKVPGTVSPLKIGPGFTHLNDLIIKTTTSFKNHILMLAESENFKKIAPYFLENDPNFLEKYLQTYSSASTLQKSPFYTPSFQNSIRSLLQTQLSHPKKLDIFPESNRLFIKTLLSSNEKLETYSVLPKEFTSLEAFMIFKKLVLPIEEKKRREENKKKD